MPTYEPVTDRAAALRAHLGKLDFDPASTPFEAERLLARSRDYDLGIDGSSPKTEVFVRLAGVGVLDSKLPVHYAAELLNILQGAITAIGSANLKDPHRGRPKRNGRPVGVRAATELYVTPDVSPGSLVFRLEANDAHDQLAIASEVLHGTGKVDSLIDEALTKLLDVLSAVEEATPESIDTIASSLRPLGSIAASKFLALSEVTQRSNVEIDVRLWSRSGRRRAASLGARGAGVLKAAAERNRERTEERTFVGILRTVSDGPDDWRLELAPEKFMKLSLADEFNLSQAGSLLSQEVRARVQVTTQWNLATGKEKFSYQLLEVSAAPTQPALHF